MRARVALSDAGLSGESVAWVTLHWKLKVRWHSDDAFSCCAAAKVATALWQCAPRHSTTQLLSESRHSLAADSHLKPRRLPRP